MNTRNRSAELPRLYTPADIAAALRCSEWWVKEQARRRRIPFTRAGGAYRFTAAHLDEIVAQFEERPHRTARAPQLRQNGVPAHEKAPSLGAPKAPVVRLRARPPRRVQNQQQIA